MAERQAQGAHTTLLVLEQGLLDGGADLGWCSQAPETRSLLFPLFSLLQMREASVVTHPITRQEMITVTVRVTTNRSAETIEQLLASAT